MPRAPRLLRRFLPAGAPGPAGMAGVPADRAFELNWQIVNTSLSRLKFRGRDVALASFNSHVHLELLRAPELITYR